MAGRDKKEADPEELLQHKFHIKCLFRAVARLALANAYWLLESSVHYEGVEDVKRRVEQAVRSQRKKKQLLSINDKALLNKPASDRTDQEKKYLYRIIGGLKCFKRYPNMVKKKLAAATYFRYYGPGRTIVRQHHEAHALYFIVTGEVVVSQMVYDELLQQYSSVEVGVMHAGDMFGEVSLLHNIPRTATVTTIDHCELLTLMKDDFKNILQVSVQQQWDEVRLAMSAFSYFDGLDERAQREGCIVAKMKSYVPNETLLGDGVGVANFVYFILSGKCQMIESIQVLVTTHLGCNYYSLYDPYIPKEDSETDFETKYFANIKTEEKESKVSEDTRSSILKHSAPRCSTSKTGVDHLKDGETSARFSCSLKREKRASSLKADNMHVALGETETSQIMELHSTTSAFIPSTDLLRPVGRDNLFNSTRFSVSIPVPQKPIRSIQTIFMQVCLFNPGSSFGFGENMRDRRIVALTPMKCMLLPLVWLLQRNTANIWTRIKYFLEKKILSKQQLYEEFVSAKRWAEYRERLVSDVIARSKTVNSTSIHDVPYSIRIEEMTEI